MIPKHQTRWVGFDDKILPLYARGMTVSEIQAHLEEMYGAEVSPSLISSVTDAVVDGVKAWQARPLDSVYPIVYLDCIHVKVGEGAVRVKAVYLAIGVKMTGEKEVLGLWLAQTEGAKFWLQVVTELRNRGVQDIFIACVDGLKGFPEAIEAVFPHTTVQLCSCAAVDRAHGAAQPELCVVEALAGGGHRSQAHLCLRHCRGGRATTLRVRGEVGQGVPADRAVVAAQLAAPDSVLRLPAGDPQGDLYHQRHPVSEHEPAQADQKP